MYKYYLNAVEVHVDSCRYELQICISEVIFTKHYMCRQALIEISTLIIINSINQSIRITDIWFDSLYFSMVWCRRLIDKQDRLEAIIASLDAESAMEQREEIEQMITASERTQLNKVKDASKTWVSIIHDIFNNW